MRAILGTKFGGPEVLVLREMPKSGLSRFEGCARNNWPATQSVLYPTISFEGNNNERPQKTAIVTGASQGIGAGIVKAFVERGFNVVANSRRMSQSTEVAGFRPGCPRGRPHRRAINGRHNRRDGACLASSRSTHWSITPASSFIKPFTDYTAEDFKSLVSTNLEGFLYVTQLAVKQMLAQKTGGSIVTITAALAATRSGASRRRCR